MIGAAKAYAAGQSPDAGTLYRAARRRAFLPTYPFQRQRYWFDGSRSIGERRSALSGEAARCFHRTEWKESPFIERPLPENVSDVLIFNDEQGVGAALGDMIRARSRRSFLVENGDGFSRLSRTSWRIDLTQPEQLARVVAEIAADGHGLSDLVFLSTCNDSPLASANISVRALESAQGRGALGVDSSAPGGARAGTGSPTRLKMSRAEHFTSTSNPEP